MLTSHTGNIGTVRKTTGGDVVSTQAIGYDAATNLIDEAALATFVGAQSWAWTALNDQTASARNVSQATTAHQPLGGVAGTATKIATRHAADFDGTNDHLERADALGLTGAVHCSAYLEIHADAVAALSSCFFLGAAVANQAFIVLANTTTSIMVSIAGSNRIFTCPDLTSTASNKIHAALASGAGIGTARVWHNGVELVELSSLNPSNVINMANTFTIHGAFSDGSVAFNGQGTDVFFWNAYLPGSADEARWLAL